MGEESERRVVPASEILAKIERGEAVEYDDVIIEGDLDISELNLPTEHVDRTEEEKQFGLSDELKVISSPITITNSEIQGKVNFSNVKFQKPVDFGGAEFGRYAGFGGAEFTGDAYFREAEFGGNANFGEAEFGGYAYFGGAEFTGDAYFREAKFTGDANFGEAEFGGDANFINVTFDNELILNNFKFGRFYITWDSIKDNLVYNGPVYLALIKNFKVIEQFSDADDCYYAYRKESQDQKPWYSQKNCLIDNVVRFYNWISTNIKRISKYFRWISDLPPITWIHRFTWSKLFDWIGLVSCGYGVKVWPIIIWGLGSVLGFALLYKILPKSYGGFVESGPSTVTIEALNNSTHILTLSPSDNIVSPSWGECLYFSFTALTGGTPEGLHPAGLLRYAVMFENVLGYTFLALFVVVLARKLIR